MIHAEKADYPVAMMCRLLGMSRSAYYAWARRGPSPSLLRRARLADLVARVFDEQRQTYGCRRIAWVLNHEHGEPCSIGLVAALMREQGLDAVQPRAYRVTTVPGQDGGGVPADAIGRDFTAAEPGTRLVGDITYLRTGQGWLYLATVIDLATRMVVGWQLAEHMRTSLVVDALAMARLHGHVAAGAVFHSDRGCQYTSREFGEWCAGRDILRSMGRTGVCFDNAAAESFFATLKNEMYYRQRFDTRKGARFAVAEYIEVFYNRKRHHSTLGYRTPARALADHHYAATAA